MRVFVSMLAVSETVHVMRNFRLRNKQGGTNVRQHQSADKDIYVHGPHAKT